MRHEIAAMGLLFPSLLACVALAGVAWFVIDWLMLRGGAWRLFWHPPLARLALYFVLLGLVAATYPDF